MIWFLKTFYVNITILIHAKWDFNEMTFILFVSILEFSLNFGTIRL
jgi:hypothetical protein